MWTTAQQRAVADWLRLPLRAMALLTLMLMVGAANCADDSAGSGSDSGRNPDVGGNDLGVGVDQGGGDEGRADQGTPDLADLVDLADLPDDDLAGPADQGPPDLPDYDLHVPSDGLVAFPGAQGFGSDTPGGRGGRVYVVTTLDRDGPGSFSEALLATEPRIIVFRVSGVIDMGDGPVLGEEHSYVTVAGQTSPGGITLTSNTGTILSNYQNNFHDGVFRFLRFRGRGNYDNIAFNDSHHLVIDHCDFSGATDETFDISSSHHVTVQWSTVTNSDPSGQNYGVLIAYAPTASFTLHHNFFAHHVNRCGPHMDWSGGVPASGAITEFSNNVVYNCAFGAIMYLNQPDEGADRISFNLVNNYFQSGPDTPEATAYAYSLPSGSRVYETGTSYDGLPTWPQWDDHVALESRVDAAPLVAIQPASDAYELVLRRVGAFPRDSMNARTIEEARTGTGTLGKLDDPLLTDAPDPPVDADLDGMPDDWEVSHGLDPGDGSDAAADRDGDGYTNIEEYINELADSLVPL